MSVRRRKHRNKHGVEKEAWTVDIDFQRPDGSRVRIRKVAPVRSRRAAEEFERQVRAALLDGSYGKEEKQAPTLGKFVPTFLDAGRADRQKHATITSKGSICRVHLVPVLGSTPLDHIGAEEIQRLKTHLAEVGLAPRSTNNVLVVLSKMLRTAEGLGLIESVPRIKLVKAAKSEMHFYEEAEFEQLVEGAGKVDDATRAVVLLGGEAGLRAGEIVALEWTDLDRVRKVIVVQRSEWRGVVGTTKNGRSRRVPMTARLAAALDKLRHLRGPRVFYRQDDTPTTVTRRILGRWVRQAERRAGLPVTGRLHVHATAHLLFAPRHARGAGEGDPGVGRPCRPADDAPLHAPRPGQPRDRHSRAR